MDKIENILKIKYDWVTSPFYKKDMNKWAVDYLKNNDVNFELLNNELQILIDIDNNTGLNSFNMYGNFEMLWSSIPNALISSLLNAKSSL